MCFFGVAEKTHTPPEWSCTHLRASYPLHKQYAEQVTPVEPYHHHLARSSVRVLPCARSVRNRCPPLNGS
jgi:hypothetical protein